MDFTIEIGGFLGRPWICIGTTKRFLHDDLSNQWGFDECTLGERLFRLIAALALYCLEHRHRWVSAGELAQIAGYGGNERSVTQLLRRVLWESPGTRGVDRVTERLIEFNARELPGGGQRGGRSRGPYRLGVLPSNIRMDEQACRQFLKLSLSANNVDSNTWETQMWTADQQASAGAFSEGLDTLQHVIDEILQYRKRKKSNLLKAHTMLLARGLDRLSTVHMEMGSWPEGLESCLRARAVYESIRHPQGIARTLQTEAHLCGQSDWPDGNLRGLWAQRKSLIYLDNASKDARKGFTRAIYSGSLGQRLTAIGAVREAANHLSRAYNMSLESSSPSWAGIWSSRLTQNFLRAGLICQAETSLGSSLNLEKYLNISGRALLLRTQAEFFLAIHHFHEAETYIQKAIDLGLRHGMKNQISRAKVLYEQFKQAQDT